MDPGQGRVLVVDDDPDVREVLEVCLLQEGYQVRAAHDGLEALERLQQWQPHLILLDLMMPVLDGWGFRARQQELDGLSDIPVVVLSAAAGAERAAGKLGAAGVLPKPFELDRLLDTVRDLLGRAA